VTNEGESTDFPDFNRKLVVMAKSLERSEKEGQVSNLRSNTYHMVKIW